MTHLPIDSSTPEPRSHPPGVDTRDSTSDLPVAVIGAGPVGLAAAAHLLERGSRPLVFEAGPSAGSGIRGWQHVRMFSPWRYNVDRASRRLLEATGWTAPDPQELPTGRDLIERYLEPLAAVPALAPHIRTRARVVAVGRLGLDKMKDRGRDGAAFQVHVETAAGDTEIHEAKAVIDATGTWGSPNPIGAGGIPAPGERAAGDRIHYGIPDVRGHDRERYAGRRVLVVGSGHSAFNALLDLAALRREAPATEILWALRRAQPESTYGGGERDALPARGQLGERLRHLVEDGVIEVLAPFEIERLEPTAGGLRILGANGGAGSVSVEPVDAVIASTGSRPELSFLREVRLDLDPALESASELAPLIDPNVHSCGTVRPHGERELRHPEAGFYIAGMKSYGRAPTFLLTTGYEQVRSIVAALAGDHAAAERVELELPETGVCSSDLVTLEEEAPVGCGSAGCSSTGETPESVHRLDP